MIKQDISEDFSGSVVDDDEGDGDYISKRVEAEIHAEDRAKRNCLFGLFYGIVTSVTFNFLIYCFILANTITLALYRYD